VDERGVDAQGDALPGEVVPGAELLGPWQPGGAMSTQGQRRARRANGLPT
jgi:hypothetical protein